MATLDSGGQSNPLALGQKITPFLWFNNNAEEAVNLYTSIFRNSKIDAVTRYGEGEHGKAGEVMSISFHLEGQAFSAINGGDYYQFSPAISFFVNCEDQEEIDFFWDKLSDGGEIMQCGWLTDRYGVTWQIVPGILGKLLYSGDAVKSQNVMQAMFKMQKLDINLLDEAFKK